jgi:hypothetical protein
MQEPYPIYEDSYRAGYRPQAKKEPTPEELKREFIKMELIEGDPGGYLRDFKNYVNQDESLASNFDQFLVTIISYLESIRKEKHQRVSREIEKETFQELDTIRRELHRGSLPIIFRRFITNLCEKLGEIEKIKKLKAFDNLFKLQSSPSYDEDWGPPEFETTEQAGPKPVNIINEKGEKQSFDIYIEFDKLTNWLQNYLYPVYKEAYELAEKSPL